MQNSGCCASKASVTCRRSQTDCTNRTAQGLAEQVPGSTPLSCISRCEEGRLIGGNLMEVESSSTHRRVVNKEFQPKMVSARAFVLVVAISLVAGAGWVTLGTT